MSSHRDKFTHRYTIPEVGMFAISMSADKKPFGLWFNGCKVATAATLPAIKSALRQRIEIELVRNITQVSDRRNVLMSVRRQLSEHADWHEFFRDVPAKGDE